MTDIKNENYLEVPVSIGELIDKLSILFVKKSKVSDSQKLKYINEELEILTSKSQIYLETPETKKNLEELVEINSELWEIEDTIRDLEREKRFDTFFVEVARKVYTLNDKRFSVKNKINVSLNSNIREVKNYKDY